MVSTGLEGSGAGKEPESGSVIRRLYPPAAQNRRNHLKDGRKPIYNGRLALVAPFLPRPIHSFNCCRGFIMKVLSSLKSAKNRHRDCKVVRRRGKIFVICKTNPRFKARQR